MRFFVFILCCFFVVLPCEAYTIKGGVSYTVESARKEAFANVEYTLPQSIIDENKVDPNFSENLKAIKSKMYKLLDRNIIVFSSGNYCLSYNNNLLYIYYYNSKGDLNLIEKNDSTTFPIKSYRYKVNGKIDSIVLSPRYGEDFVFEPSGRLRCYWKDNVGYDMNGKKIGERN